MGLVGLLFYAALSALGAACVVVLAPISWFLLVERAHLGIDVATLAFLECGVAAAFVLFAVFTLAQMESLRFCAWSLFARRDQFMALRGWRPPVGRLFANFTRQMGLPAFLSSFARGRFGLATYFLIIAILNSFFFVLLSIPVGAGPYILAMVRLYFAYGGDYASAPYAVLEKTAEENNPAPAFMAVFLAIVLVIPRLARFGKFVRARARRRATQLYQDVREWDPRRPIVYLRAFDVDKRSVPGGKQNPVLHGIVGEAMAGTFDELLLDALSPWGPVIAIGDPSDKIPPLGAARVFVRNAGQDWQDVVRSLLEASSAIVISPNRSAGVSWELAQIEAPEFRQKTIYVANPHAPAAETDALFADIFKCDPPRGGDHVVAASYGEKEGWRVLCAPQASWQSLSVAVSFAIQSLLGERGLALKAQGKRENSQSQAR